MVSVKSTSQLQRFRFIPAPAGKQSPIPAVNPPCSGSSPRLRGTDYGCGPPDWKQRFIPAPAGNSCQISVRSVSNPVHPRACGEQVFQVADLARDLGSSPRLRGTALLTNHLTGGCRFIPAPAGNRWTGIR